MVAPRRDGGFTLIELLTVVVIIGALSAIAIPRFIGHRDRAAASAAASSLRGAVNVIPDLLEDNVVFPSEVAVIAAADAAINGVGFVAGDTVVVDDRTISISRSADARTVVMATASVTGDCFFARVRVDGQIERHRVDELVNCRGDALAPAQLALGW